MLWPDRRQAPCLPCKLFAALLQRKTKKHKLHLKGCKGYRLLLNILESLYQDM